MKIAFFFKKNGIFIFLKTPIKRTKKYIIASDTFFFFNFFFLKKGKNWGKVGQKNWIFIIPPY
jgi:hypothetical protein